MGALLQDIRYGIRMLRGIRVSQLSHVLSLALGIGGNATVFSWLEAVFFIRSRSSKIPSNSSPSKA